MCVGGTLDPGPWQLRPWRLACRHQLVHMRPAVLSLRCRVPSWWTLAAVN